MREILLQSAISSTYLQKSFLKENVFKAKKQDFQKKEVHKRIPR